MNVAHCEQQSTETTSQFYVADFLAATSSGLRDWSLRLNAKYIHGLYPHPPPHPARDFFFPSSTVNIVSFS